MYDDDSCQPDVPTTYPHPKWNKNCCSLLPTYRFFLSLYHPFIDTEYDAVLINHNPLRGSQIDSRKLCIESFCILIAVQTTADTRVKYLCDHHTHFWDRSVSSSLSIRVVRCHRHCAKCGLIWLICPFFYYYNYHIS